MNLLGSLIILLFPFYQLTQLNFILPFSLPFRLYFYDLILFLFVFPQITTWFKKIPSQKSFKPFIAFSLFSLFSLFLAGLIFHLNLNQLFLSSLYLFRFFFTLSLFFCRFTIKQKKLFSLSLFLIPLSGLLQYLFLPDLRFLKSIGFDDHLYRLSFPFLDPNYTGMALTFIFLSSLGRWRENKSRTLLFLSLMALILTLSRASYLALFLGLGYLLFYLPSKTKRLFIPALIIFLSLVYLVPKPFGEGVNLLRTFSITSRLDNYRHGLNLALKNPLTGLGFNTLATHQNQSQNLIFRASGGLDNSFIFILATGGIFGLFLYLRLLLSLFRSTKSIYLKASLVALTVHSFFNNSLFYAPLLILLVLQFNSSLRNEPSA